MIGHGGLLRVFSFARLIRGSGMSIVGFTLTVANDFADLSVNNSQPILIHYFKRYFLVMGRLPLKMSLRNIVYM